MTPQQQIDAIVNATYKKVAGYIDEALNQSAYAVINAGKAEAFALAKTPRLQAKIDAIFKEMGVKVNNIITGSINASWGLANRNMDKLLAKYLVGKKIPADMAKVIFQKNASALKAFVTRSEGGVSLSDKIWTFTDIAKSEMTLLLEEGIATGKSAATLSQDIRHILKEPNKLFRRIRNAEGKLVLSKAARNYHPGQGVYRSSYMNAKRLTATENNMAYRSADMERYNQIDFIMGYEVILSGNHPKEDICDEMQGKYPKEFVFTGWHPFCICHCEAILPSEDDFVKYLQDDTSVLDKYAVEDIPGRAQGYIDDNLEALKGGSSTPYFLADNADYLGIKL
jgi:hypothetical protein